MTEEQPSVLPRPMVYKMLIVLVLVSVLSWAASTLLAPDGTLPEVLKKEKTVDYFNPGYSFQHLASSHVVPEYSEGSQLAKEGIPSHIVVLHDVNEQEDGAGIIEIYAVMLGEGETWQDLQNQMPYMFAFGPVTTEPASWAGGEATSYEAYTQGEGRVMMVKGMWTTVQHRGKTMMLDIRMSVFGPADIDEAIVRQYENEYEHIRSSLIVHNPPSG